METIHKVKITIPLDISGECIALKTLSTGKSIVVIYREVSSEDGFVITAFITSKKTQFERRVRLWPL